MIVSRSEPHFSRSYTFRCDACIEQRYNVCGGVTFVVNKWNENYLQMHPNKMMTNLTLASKYLHCCVSLLIKFGTE